MFITNVSLFFTYASRLIRNDVPLKIGEVEAWPENKPFVSVIVPCYNHGQFIDEAVQSILEQTWQNFEIIVVNDGSTEEETLNILKDFTRPKTRVLHLPKNMGLPAARNAGIAEARGKYICCLDSDDKLHPTYLEKAIVAMEINSGLSFIGSWTQVFGNEYRVWYSLQFDPDQIIYYNQFGPPTVFKRSAWEQTSGFSDEMREGFEDWEFWVRLTGLGHRGYRISEKMILYRRIGYSFALRAAEKREYLFEKIKKNNPAIYENPKESIGKIKKSYRDIYSPAPFVNLNDCRHYLQTAVTPHMIISDLNSEATITALNNQDTHSPMIWVAKHALDEKATDLLYETTPYVYILPNFLPRYIHEEFIQNLMKIWNIQSPQKIKSSAS